jgi:hypothetical protein
METLAQRSLPLIGFDRNQPFRRALSRLGLDLPVRHLGPAVVYHFGKTILIRPSSVEAWLAGCSTIYPGQGTRDFWESVWNLAMSSWDYIDTVGREPWSPPSPAFPLFDPRFWRGGRRNHLLFARADRYIDHLGISNAAHFRAWLDGMVRFQYGEGLDTVPLGMAALALNAPSETYLSEIGLPTSLIVRPSLPEPGYHPGKTAAWRIPFTPGGTFQNDPHPVHQVFFDEPMDRLAAQTVVLTKGLEGRGWLYFRTVKAREAELPSLDLLQQCISQALGSGWGTLEASSAEVLPPLQVGPGTDPSPHRPEPGWPWLGDVRALIALQPDSLRSCE